MWVSVERRPDAFGGKFIDSLFLNFWRFLMASVVAR